MRLWKRLDHDVAGIVCIECGLVQQEAILLVDGHALRIARVVDHEPAHAEAERRLLKAGGTPGAQHSSKSLHRVLCSVKLNRQENANHRYALTFTGE
jgi:hypothetical protein